MTPLRQRFIEDMQLRNFSPVTQASYTREVSGFARHFNKSPELLGPEQIRAYQVYLRNEKKLGVVSISVATSALRFLHRVTLKKNCYMADMIPAPKVPKKLPVILSPEAPQPSTRGRKRQSAKCRQSLAEFSLTVSNNEAQHILMT